MKIKNQLMMLKVLLKRFVFFIIIFSTSVLHAQYLSNNSYMVFKDGVKVVTNGTFTNFNNGSITSMGISSDFTIKGDLINNGLNGIDFSGINLKLTGSGNSIISGSNSISFGKIILNKDNNFNIVSLERPITINDEFIFNSGLFDLLDYDIIIGSTGKLTNESNESRIISSDGLTEGVGIGKIIATPILISGLNTNISGLGIDIYSTSFTGLQTVIRGNQFHYGTGSSALNTSVFRYFNLPSFGEVTATNYINIQYFESELNSHLEDELIVYQYVENDIDHQMYWTPLNTIRNSLSDNCDVFSTGLWDYYVLNLGGYSYTSGMFTLGSISTPLPVNLLNFNANCTNNGAVFNWTIASETNNNFFTLEKSYDGINYIEVAHIPSVGNSNQLIDYSYQYEVKESVKTYFRLTQTDFNGNIDYYNSIVLDCNSYNYKANELTKIYTPDNRKIVIDYQSTKDEDIKISVINDFGQSIYYKLNHVSIGANHIEINNLNISSGVYFVEIYSDYYQFKEKVLLINN